jgi:hypothetical protein
LTAWVALGGSKVQAIYYPAVNGGNHDPPPDHTQVFRLVWMAGLLYLKWTTESGIRLHAEGSWWAETSRTMTKLGRLP